ncbi:MAG TPA: hypothetical protein DEQ74_02000 [Wolbachia sp.]|jgi:F-type H+-transporting ATPase subunit b|uniref:F0F1 ATP synthase subunit B family protein n=1 Tax=Wolbachia endosymbiont of Pentalonia nigronervosa TaxID=1301914 RepID=UPI000EBFFBCC|nr:hypothetical protein [Wolbachia endosymbiont of Pentalonia nigronervosa]MBD0390971.1 hypothetical protein [Wolbachia endosymbiont of Pentalonia nigronervosa]HCE59583.1 hypothetical protein [Wolbachia sp.]
MPQLDISTFFSQVFWFLTFFSLLFCVVSCLFLPKLDNIIYTRNKEVVDSLNSSLCLLRFTEDMVNKYNAALHQAKMQAKKIMDDALVQVEEMRADVQNLLAEEKKKMNELVKEGIAKFKVEYIEELKQMSVGIALIYYTKLTNSKAKEKLLVNLVSKEF